MVIHMKTTLVIDDQVMKRLKQEAARQGKTISALVESALRMLLTKNAPQLRLRPLPEFDGQGSLVDISDRDALYHAMEGR
jgi:hypothetical protein